MRLNIIVEGPSEETFVRDVLSPYLGSRGVYAVARSVETSRTRVRTVRGGLRDYKRARNDFLRWLKQDTGAVVPTMFDLYALPTSFPGVATAPAAGVARVGHVEEAFARDIASRRFVPYIQRHEYEALMFGDVAEIDREPGSSSLSTDTAGSRCSLP